MIKRLFRISIAFGLAVAAPSAMAANCGLRDHVVERLESKYSEQLTVGGLQNSNPAQSVMEIWSSVETGTFTVLVTQPNGVSCIVAAGTDFFEVERSLEPAGIAG